MNKNNINKTYCNSCGKHNCNFKSYLISPEHQNKLSSQLLFHNDKKEHKLYECIICNKKHYNLKIHERSEKH